MPPFYDIYGLSNQRDKSTIEKFLNEFSYREKIESRSGQEILIDKNDKYQVEAQKKPIVSLTEVIHFGVENQNWGFVFYVSNDLKEGIDGIILKFTFDAKIVFGISIEKNVLYARQGLVDNYGKALEIESLISELTKSSKTSIQVEYAPPDDEDEFELMIRSNRRLF